MRRFLAIAACAALPLCEVAADDRRPFTVADSIEMTRLLEPSTDYGPPNAPAFKFSPNGASFVVVTRKGNLATGLNEDALLLFDVADVLAFVNTPTRSTRPRQEVLVRFATSSDKHGIDQVQWLPDSQGIAFIGRGADRKGQVYTVDIGTWHVRQLTRHPGDIGTFDLAWKAQKLVFAAFSAPDWTDRNAHGYAVKSEYSRYLSTRDPGDAVPEVKYFVSDLLTSRVLPVNVPAAEYYLGIDIDPTGRWAVIRAQVLPVPLRWSEYAFLKEMIDRTARPFGGPELDPTGRFLDDDAFGGPLWLFAQFHLVDTTTGTARPLLDAPAIILPQIPARWTQDGARVLVGPTYLPLDEVEPAERERRLRVLAIVEVEIATGKLARLADAETITAEGRIAGSFTGVDWVTGGGVTVDFQRHGSGGAQEPLLRERYRKQGEKWLPDARRPASDNSRQTRLRLSIAQDMNTPPDIAALDHRTGRQRLITEYNPQLRDLSLGRVETFTWTDRLDRTFTGGLVLPPNFTPGTRLPLVIQTYGFRADEFLVDGPGGMKTAYAARPLANHGILVLQAPDLEFQTAATEKGYEKQGEIPTFIAGMEGAIDALDARGLVDRNRIGLIGFSREGMHVEGAVTFSRYPIAAATIADSLAATLSGMTNFYGSFYPGMAGWEDEKLMGAPFWGAGIRLWLERSPAFHLDRIRTPMRFEHIGTSVGRPNHWDTFALLKRFRRPAEMIHIPDGKHRLDTPFTRYTSQQGNVDWFVFWLKGDEDADPAKIEQYERWRKLRRQHEAHLAGLRVEVPSSAEKTTAESSR